MITPEDILKAVAAIDRAGRVVVCCLEQLAADQTARDLGMKGDPDEILAALWRAINSGMIHVERTDGVRIVYGSRDVYELSIVRLSPAPVRV